MSLTRTLLRTPHTIACIGRNYADHIKELNNTTPASHSSSSSPPAPFYTPTPGPCYQETAKSKRLPWTLCKGFKTFLPVSGFIPKSLIPNAQDAELYLSVNGEVRQQDSTALMLFGVPKLLQHVTGVTTLYEDDLVLTGTPKGVGKVVAGDVMRAGIRVGGRDIEEGRIEVRVEDRVGGFGA
ncbi:uncharacterized protein LAJ45_11271 [Morchella importuna]|uniref:uncharacterized protein n=1 Tax=Morchella importuna TaxID=1174673 RepID=UPI001E8DC20F|nr:uncharacterized protein LAJ45_11271 [Morchella importuna]KAH8144678.1 hypothetical protein LAJ45_11271 [Morchella importuna]